VAIHAGKPHGPSEMEKKFHGVKMMKYSIIPIAERSGAKFTDAKHSPKKY
jgi:hypothetical protein